MTEGDPIADADTARLIVITLFFLFGMKQGRERGLLLGKEVSSTARGKGHVNNDFCLARWHERNHGERSPPSLSPHRDTWVVVPTRVGQVYVYDTVKPDQDEYDVLPRHQPPTQHDIYDVPPARQQYNTQGERVSIQSRPLPSPPKFTAAEEEEGVDRPYGTTEEGWMEDYDYVHLQGKEEFEKNQKQLLEKGNIIRHKTQLEQQQIKQFERLEQEVSRPINNDMTGWVPPPHHPSANQQAQNGSRPPPCSKLCNGDRQLILFYQEQCEQNVTAVTNAIDAFFTAVNSNQPPKIFVAHSKFVILSAHKLVFIGDTLSRQAKSPEARAHVAQSSNALCEKLKDIVVSTKTAALQYPSPGATREMTERVRELAGCTQHFRMLLGQLLVM
ncbi:breast cancer anti-estrogen resistance protein 1 [Pungitius pungitius]|uniref:breast cancer anti-estrogen resistance protein 1 n=1 Tax=Pungitius pungitius TaxID=134920 RepID=UPI002E103503